MTTPTFGIDLGTTCSLIGYVRDGHPRLVSIDGSVLLPSVVTFPAEGDVVVGKAALNQLLLMPERTLRSTKRRMGSAHHWTVGDRMLTAPDVATEILRALVRGAEAETGMRPERVVVSVPAWFPHDARADTRRAVEAAGLEVLRLINEPTAAALAHGHLEQRERLALVYDLGGGTFDASLVHQQGGLIEVKASAGDAHLGGDDLDRRLLVRMMESLDESDPALAAAVRENRGARERFLGALREAKHELSAGLTAELRVPFLTDVDGEARHLELELDRDLLEVEFTPLLERTFSCIDRVLDDAGVQPSDVDELLLVGGSSRIPLVWQALESRYNWKGNAAVPSQEAVGLGTAIQAAIVGGESVGGVLLDVTPHALSVATLSEEQRHFTCVTITPRNTSLPGRHTQRFFTMGSYQSSLSIPVMQGSNPNPLRNIPLGTIAIDSLPPAPEGRSNRPIAIEFSQDLSGLVSIRLTDELSGRTVDGQVVVGGEESERARELLIQAIEVDGLIPGDGSDPDPYLEHGPGPDELLDLEEDWPAGKAPTSVPASVQAACTEAGSAFDALLAQQADLASNHPEHALGLRQLATSGQEALAAGNSELALAKYDELSDRLFELGVYL